MFCFLILFRCDLVISANGKTEKIASGLLNPFLAHLKIAQEQMAKGGYSIILEPEPGSDASWFTKGTIERFVSVILKPFSLWVHGTCSFWLTNYTFWGLIHLFLLMGWVQCNLDNIPFIIKHILVDGPVNDVYLAKCTLLCTILLHHLASARLMCLLNL